MRFKNVVALLFISIMATPACGPASGPETVLKPLEERRARAVIEGAIRSSGMQPTAPQAVELKRNGAKLTEDMRIGSGPYSVAYLTHDEERRLGSNIVQRDPEDETLRLEPGSKGEIVLILWAQNYRFDQGEKHSATAVTAERKLKRDVSDFIQQVVKQGKGK